MMPEITIGELLTWLFTKLVLREIFLVQGSAGVSIFSAGKCRGIGAGMEGIKILTKKNLVS